MSHSAPPPHKRSRLELAVGIIALVFALTSGAFAITALEHPKGRAASRASSVPSSSASHAKPSTTTSAKHPASSASPKAGTQTRSTNRPSVIILNNTSDASRVTTAIQRLTAGGWTASDGGSFSGSIVSTAVYYDPSAAGAQTAATALQAQFPAIQRVKQKFDGLPSGPLILILTTDYS